MLYIRSSFFVCAQETLGSVGTRRAVSVYITILIFDSGHSTLCPYKNNKALEFQGLYFLKVIRSVINSLFNSSSVSFKLYKV